MPESDTVEHYWSVQEENAEGGTRFAEYSEGKKRAAEMVLEDEGVTSVDILEEADEVDDGPHTYGAAVAKGMRDAVSELAEMADLEEVVAEDEETDTGSLQTDEREEVERDTESIAESGGIEVDADEVEPADDEVEDDEEDEDDES